LSGVSLSQEQELGVPHKTGSQTMTTEKENLSACCKEKISYWGANLICQGCFQQVQVGA
jgi:hypothetical protein